MSADNWATCPACYAEAVAKSNEAKLEAGQAYGKVTPEEYLELFNKAQKPVELDQSLREDYEVGIDKNGEFEVIYTGQCSCGFKYRFQHTEKVPLP